MLQDPLAPLVKLFEENLEWAAAVARIVHRRVPPSFDIEDLEQVARIEMWERCQRYDPFNENGVPFRGYAYIYVLNACRMHCRRKAWKEATAPGLTASMVDAKPRPDERVAAKQDQNRESCRQYRQRTWLQGQIAQLPAMDAYLMQRHYLDGVDLEEVAELAGMEQRQLRLRLAGVVRQLKKARQA